jgi:hypothetical protein
MKIGNTSQSNVPVPNFFLNKNITQMETFEISKGKKYFTEKDLFRNTKDINFCNNRRNFNRKFDEFNRTKFTPDKTSLNFLNTTSNFNPTSNIKRKFISNENNKGNKDNNTNNFNNTNNEWDKDKTNPNTKSDKYNNYRNFLEKTNVTNILNPDLKQEIKTNINVLLEKINHNYDLEKWGSTDTRTNFINLNTNSNTNKMCSTYNYNDKFYLNNNKGFFSDEYAQLNFNKFNNTFSNFENFDEKNFNQTDASKFKSILRDKINGMNIDKKLKDKLVRNIDVDLNNEKSNSDKYYKFKTNQNQNKNKKTKSSNFPDIDSNERPLPTQTQIQTQNNTQNLTLAQNQNQEYLGETNETKIDTNMNTINEFKTSNDPMCKFDNNLNSYNFNSKNDDDNYNDNYNENYNNFNLKKICLPQVMTKYSNVSSNSNNNQIEIDKLKRENKQIYNRFKDSNLFKDFPSPDRKEFVIKKRELIKTNVKKNKIFDKNLVDFSNYNASRHKSVFCEEYGTNQGIMNKFKNDKKTFI